MSTAIATFSSTVAADEVANRTVTWMLTPGGTGAPVVTTHTLLATSTSDTLACNPGDTVSFSVVDANAIGASTASNLLFGTVPPPLATAVPTTPVALTLAFTNP